MICDYDDDDDDDDDDEGDDQKDEDKHGDDLGPHEASVIVKPTVVVVAVLGSPAR